MDGSALRSYRRGMESGNAELVLASLADDVVLHVAVHDAPVRGIRPAGFLFSVLMTYFDGFRVLEEVGGDAATVVLFRTGLDGYAGEAEGVNVLRFDDNGLIKELTVFLRPLAALQATADHVGPRMAEKFGQLPDPA